jgi:hypothetical protein
MKIKNNKEIPGNLTGVLEWCDGAKESVNYIGYVNFMKNGKSHRENGPAKIWSDGTIEYYLGGIYQGAGIFKKAK